MSILIVILLQHRLVEAHNIHTLDAILANRLEVLHLLNTYPTARLHDIRTVRRNREASINTIWYHNKRRCRKKPPEFVSHVLSTSTIDKEVDADADVD